MVRRTYTEEFRISAVKQVTENVCERLRTSNKHKYRALFYALLAKNFGKVSVYD